jgi:dihydropyrimidinase
VDYNVYEGMTVRGVPEKVYLRGKKVVDGDQWTGEKGKGQFVARKPHAPVL